MNANPPAGQPGNLKHWMIGGAIAVPVGIAIVGFTPAGVAAGSIAAGIHSGIGGFVAAGSPFAISQSLGTMPLVGATIGMAGVAIAGLVHRYVVPYLPGVFGAMNAAFWTAVGVAESLWLRLEDMLKDAFWTAVGVAESLWEMLFGSQGKSKMQ